MGLFTKSEIKKVFTIKTDISELKSDCMSCGLYKNKTKPQIEYTGEGKKKILIIGETITEEDELYGTPFSDEEGILLEKHLRFNGINLHKDCWRMKAIRCRTYTPTYNQIRACYPFIEKTIKTLKPSLVLVLGDKVISSLFGTDFSNRDILRWRGHLIPDQTLKCNIFPLFSITQLLKEKKNKNLRSLFERDLKNATDNVNLPFIEQKNHEQYVTMLKDFESLKSILLKVLGRKPLITYDYETTGLKPFKNGHKIVTISFSVNETKAYSFPYQYRNFWTENEQKIIYTLWRKILKDPKIKKVMQNSKFEEIWGKIFFKVRHKCHFDTLICAHILDNRSGVSGLKFLSFVNFGVRPYDKDIKPYLKTNSKTKGEFNRVEQLPLNDLLLYNGLDCIYTHMLYNKQIKIITKQKGLLKAYNFFMAGNKEMATLQLNGFCMDTLYYKKTRFKLNNKIKEIEKELTTGREAKAFKKQYGKPFLLTSNQDLGKLFYDILGKEPIYTAKGNYKTDKETLEKLNLPFVTKLFNKKKYEKALGTYLGQFEREIVNNRIHPFFDLHIPVSYRSCIAKGSKILTMRDFEKYPDGVPIEEIKKGDMVYCFDDNLNPVLRPVLWAGKTGVKQIVRITYYRKGHGYGHLECTPEHKIRLIDGSYIEAQDLLKEKHYEKQTAKSPNCHVLAGARRGDCLNFTNHLFNGTGIKEHRFIYSQLIGELLPDEIIHHKNLNHLDHTPSNLEKHTKSSHAKIHVKHTLCSPKSRHGNQYGSFSPGNHAIVGVKKLKKLVNVYDIEVKDYHNFFANEICVHNSSSAPNFQNQPKRDEEIKKYIRSGIIPRKGCVISEIDYSGSEVIASASCHKDPKFIAYLMDKSTDMHRDNATDLLMLPHETLERTDYNKEQKKAVKKIRFYAKNQWTFAQFYGDWYGSCAPNFWANVIEAGLKLPDGTTCKEWLESKGIFELGEIEYGQPEPGSFLEHCKNVEDKMWNKRFPQYTQWKKDIVDFYQKYGYIESLFGFKFTGYMTNNQCTNFPIQSASFHLLLYALIEAQKMIKKEKLKTKLIGQVHDSIISDVPIDEIEIYHEGVYKIVSDLQNVFNWLVVPMSIEIEISKSRKNKGSLAEMQEFKIDEIKNKKYLEYV